MSHDLSNNLCTLPYSNRFIDKPVLGVFAEDIRDHTAMLLGSSNFNLQIIDGPGGLGKTYQTTKTLESMAVPYQPIRGYCTPLSLYKKLNEHRDNLFVLDDVEGLLAQQNGLSILKAATWTGHDNKRIVNWHSNALQDGDKSFCFEGKIIIITNGQVDDSGIFGPLISRALICSIRPTLEQRWEILDSCAATYSDKGAADEAVQWLKNKVGVSSAKINLRTLLAVYEARKTNPSRWTRIAERLGANTDPLEIVHVLSKSGKSTSEQAREFVSRTGGCERTFYNLRKKL